jgi:hypothetical protein
LRSQLRQASEVLGDGCKHELVLCTARTAQAKTTEPQNALQVRKPHLDAFTIMP